jgi:hypothetical protein
MDYHSAQNLRVHANPTLLRAVHRLASRHSNHGDNMRTALTIIALLSFGSAGFAQQNIDPNQQPAWFTTGEKWGSWVPFTQYPFLSVRGACGDDTTLNGVPMFTLYTQIRNNSAYPMAVVSAEEMYDLKTRKNIVSGSFLEYLNPGQITEGISSIGGNCGATRIFYSKIRCAAKKGDEGATCFKDSQGNAILERTDQFRERPPQAGTSGNVSRNPKLAPAYWVCSADSSNPPNYNDTVITNPFKHGVEPDVFQHNVNSGDYVPIPEAGGTTLLYSQFIAWRNSTYRYNSDEYAWCMVFSSQEQAEAYVQKRKQTHDPYHQGSKFEIVDWSPK